MVCRCLDKGWTLDCCPAPNRCTDLASFQIQSTTDLLATAVGVSFAHDET